MKLFIKIPIINRKVLFGTELRVKIPPLPTSTFESKTDVLSGKIKDSQKSVLSFIDMEFFE